MRYKNKASFDCVRIVWCGFFRPFYWMRYGQNTGNTFLFGQPAMLWAASTPALLVLPVIIVSTEEALNSVPVSLREAAFALGATKWQVVRNVVLPQARSGILTGRFLAFLLNLSVFILGSVRDEG